MIINNIFPFFAYFSKTISVFGAEKIKKKKIENNEFFFAYFSKTIAKIP